MSFDATDAATGISGVRHEILTQDRFHDAAPSLAVAAGDDAA